MEARHGFRPVLALLATLLVSLPAASSGRSLTVSADGNGAYATIQEAMAASVAGDTVRVGAGTYREPVALKSGVALLGSGSEDTRLELDGEGTQVYASEVSDAEISGFSLAYTGTGSYHTVLVRGSRVRISDCRMTNPREVTVYVIEASQVTIEHCVVEHGAPGILLEGGSHGVIRDSRVRNSRTIGIVFLGGASGEVTGSEVMDHGTYGIVVSGAGPVRLAENVVTGNADAGILGMDEGELEIHRNTLVDNGSNGVRLVSGSTATVVDNTLVGHRGGGVSAEEFRNVAEIGYNDVWDNGTDYWGLPAPASDLSIDPLFVNAAEGDYHLLPDSPLRAAGSDGGTIGALGPAGTGQHPDSLTVVQAEELADELPGAHRLGESFANPFNPRTTIVYDVARAGRVRLSIHAITGQCLRTLVAEERVAGRYSVAWNGRDADGRLVATGLHLCRMETGGYVGVRKMALLR